MMYETELDSLKRLVKTQEIQIIHQKEQIDNINVVLIDLIGGLFNPVTQLKAIEMYIGILESSIHIDTISNPEEYSSTVLAPTTRQCDKLEKRIELLESEMKKQIIPDNGPLTINEITQEIQARETTDMDVWWRGDSSNPDYDGKWAEMWHASDSSAKLSARESMLLHLHDGCDEGCTHEVHTEFEDEDDYDDDDENYYEDDEDNYNEHEGHELNYENFGYWA